MCVMNATQIARNSALLRMLEVEAEVPDVDESSNILMPRYDFTVLFSVQ